MKNKNRFFSRKFVFVAGFFLGISGVAYAANETMSIGDDFMIFKRVGSTPEVNVGIGTIDPQAKLEVNGNIIAAEPAAGNHVATRNYVDGKVAAAGSAEELYGKVCPSGQTFAGYGADGSINCTDLVTGDINGGILNINFTDGISDGAGNYFSVGGGDNFCLQYTVSSGGHTSFSEINDGLQCELTGNFACWDAQCLQVDNGENQFCRDYDIVSGIYTEANDGLTCRTSPNSDCWDSVCLEIDNGGDRYCRDYDLVAGTYTNTHEIDICGMSGADTLRCNAGDCVGGACAVTDGSGLLKIIDYDGSQWIGCTQLDCSYASTGKIPRHVTNDGSEPDDICDDPIYATTVDPVTGALGGYAWGSDAGYISLSGSGYGVSLPAGLASGDVTGYAWGSDVGYINFCNNAEGYCVQYNSGTDQLSGYAWGSDVGYIKFDGVDIDSDTLADYGVYVDRNVNRLQGTAWGSSAGYIRFTEEADPAY